jgi:putative oxidoreductase
MTMSPPVSHLQPREQNAQKTSFRQAYNFDCSDPAASCEAYCRRPLIACDAANVAERKEPRMNIAFLIGRIIFGGYWLMASFNHFKNLNYMSEYAKARGTPSPKLAVAGTGVILLLGGLSMLLGVYPVVGIVLLIIFLLGVSFQIHSFWKVDDAQMKQIDMINFTKNMALVGALLMFLLLPHPWPMSLGIG